MNEPKITPQTDTSGQVPATPLRCVTGAAISGTLTLFMYSVMSAIATNFATRPIHSANPLVVNISTAVRTLVVGVVALGTGIFGLVAVGLLALAVQLLVQQGKSKSSEN